MTSGDSKGNLKRGKNSLNKSRTIANSILEHGDFIGIGIEEDRLSNKSYGSHKHRFKDESHKGSADTLDQDQDEKRDASKEELGIEDGSYIVKKICSVNIFQSDFHDVTKKIDCFFV